jgi:regulator of protease activity HflC (stomatin/prohibitin superfamily)
MPITRHAAIAMLAGGSFLAVPALSATPAQNAVLPFDSLPFVRAQVEHNADVVAERATASEAATQAAKAEADAEESAAQAEAQQQAAAANDPFPYLAVVTCSFNGMRTALLACFAGKQGSPDTNFELRNGKSYGLYQPYQIEELGREADDGMEIPLARHFEITAQNAADSLILGIKIIDKHSHNVLFEKQVGQFDAIIASSNDLDR